MVVFNQNAVGPCRETFAPDLVLCSSRVRVDVGKDFNRHAALVEMLLPVQVF